MSQQMVTLSLVTKSDLAWGAAYNLLSGIVLDHGSEFAQTSLTTLDMDDIPEEELYHDEDTLVMVHNAIADVIEAKFGTAISVTPAVTNDIINALQNAGILFRENHK